MAEYQEPKICPLSLCSTRERLEPCMKEKCAWWMKLTYDIDHKDCSRCAIMDIAISLRALPFAGKGI